MRRFILIVGILLTAFSYNSHGQNALTMLKFEDAEKAFNNGNYAEALQHLDEVEKAAGVTSKTLYLRIVIENKQFDNGAGLYEDKAKFNQLQSLRQRAAKYLKALSKQGIDDKYREVYRISENLTTFPKNSQEWEEGKQAYAIQKKKEQQLLREKQLNLERRRNAAEELNQYIGGTLSADQIKYNALSQVTEENSGNYCTIYFYREPKMSGRLVRTKIFLHDRFIFSLAAKRYKKVCLSPGLVKLNALHGTLKDSERNIHRKVYTNTSLFFTTTPQRTYYIDVAYGASIKLSLVNENKAKKFISEYEEMED